MDLTNKKILILAPHPDDEIISSLSIIEEAKKCGGIIKVVFITSGEYNYLGSVKFTKSLKLNKQEYAFIRENEAKSVMQELGISDFEFWRIPDLAVSKNKKLLFKNLLKTIDNFSPHILISPSYYDLHKDHNSTAIVVSHIANKFKGLKVYYYIIHSNNTIDSLPLNTIKLSRELKDKKRKLFTYYKSQFLYNKSFFLARLDKEQFLPSEYKNKLDSPIEIDFVGQDFIWIKIKYKSFFFNPLKMHIAVMAKDNIYDFSSTIRWNKKVVPLYLNPDKTLCTYIKIQRLINEQGGYLIIPFSYFKDSDQLFVKLSNINPVFDVTGYIPIERKMKSINRNREPKVCVVIPCFNIAKLCSKTVEKALKYSDYLVVVNDGSTDNTKESLDSLAEKNQKLHILHLPKNMGKGNALIKGILYAFDNIDFDLLITMDGDLQHRPEDIPLFKKAWQNGADMILGVRTWDKNVPFRSKIGNYFINKLCGFLLRTKVTDSQTGFRGFSKPLLKKIINSDCIKAGRYETELDIFLYSYLSGARVSEVEIPTIYLEGNASSHFNPVLDSLRIIKEAISFYMRFYRLQREELEDKVIIDNS